MPEKRFSIALAGTAVALLFVVFLGVRQYDGNVSALLHMDVPFGEQQQVPGGIVLYQDGGYDGMAYYQIARDIPALFFGGDISFDSPYRFQRILLPLFVFVGSLGNQNAFPYVFVIINLLSAIGSLIITVLITRKVSLHALTIVFNPAMLIGILYTLTEPLSIFFMMVFFYYWLKNNQKLSAVTIIALLLSLLARETTVFLIGLLFLWSIWKREWKQAALVVIPMIILIVWQYFLALRFGDIGFQANGNIVSVPFGGLIALMIWLSEKITAYRLSTVGLLFFLIPLCIVLGKEWSQKKMKVDVLCFLLSGLCATVFLMDTHMWGAITSIGRVVTPLYPVYALYAATRETRMNTVISTILIVMSTLAAIGIASVSHPFTVS